MDVVTAFLYPSLEEEIYMRLPEDHLNGKVVRLKKSIYGLKQASRAWNFEITKTLRKLGFMQSSYDPCIFMMQNSQNLLYVAVYVDDLLIFTNNKKKKQWLKSELASKFQMKALGKAHYCLGMRIMQDRDAGLITLDQTRYIHEMLKKFGMDQCHGASTPIESGQPLSKAYVFENCRGEKPNV